MCLFRKKFVIFLFISGCKFVFQHKELKQKLVSIIKLNEIKFLK